MRNDELHASFHLIGMIIVIDDLWCRSFLIPAHLEKPTSWITTWNVVPFPMPKNKKVSYKTQYILGMATPFLVIVNTRIFTCLVGNPFKSSFVTAKLQTEQKSRSFGPKTFSISSPKMKMHPNQNWQISRGDRITHNTTTFPMSFFVPCNHHHHHHHLYAQKKHLLFFQNFHPRFEVSWPISAETSVFSPSKPLNPGKGCWMFHMLPLQGPCVCPMELWVTQRSFRPPVDGSGKSFPNRKMEGFKTSTAAANLGPEQWEGSLSKEKRCEISCFITKQKTLQSFVSSWLFGGGCF